MGVEQATPLFIFQCLARLPRKDRHPLACPCSPHACPFSSLRACDWMLMRVCNEHECLSVSRADHLAEAQCPTPVVQYMMPDQFCKWYRFAFHLCKEPQRKHVQVCFSGSQPYSRGTIPKK
eukprot:1160493-Pelagomonas_calceolata.AAC.7